MRTTLDIDDDILQAAKDLAQSRGSTAGRVISDLARRALAQPASGGPIRNGVPLLPPRGAAEPRVTARRVSDLRDGSETDWR